MENIGAVRVRGIAKYLPEFGWTPVILTVESPIIADNKNIVFETPYENIVQIWKNRIGIPSNKTFKEYFHFGSEKKRTLIDKIIDQWTDIFTYPDITFNWSVTAIEEGDKIIKKGHFDAILSSSSPITSHIIAKELVKRNNIPWIADFRDLWTQNHYYHNIHSRMRLFFEKRLELTTLSSANAFITTSQPLSDKLKTLHTNKKIYVITNGYDPEQINPGIPLTKKFSITLTGKIYAGLQDPEPLFKTLRILIDENLLDPTSIEINFFGDNEGWLTNDVKKYDLQNIVQIYGQISREESIQKQRESQILLLLTWNDPDEKGVYTGKIFDYLAAKRPILAIGQNRTVITDLLNQTQAGVNVISDKEIKDQILKLYHEYRQNGYVKYSGVTSEIENYSHRVMAKKFSEILEKICK
jgi:glycosyltransferase involved in cell wall biosynthesis